MQVGRDFFAFDPISLQFLALPADAYDAGALANRLQSGVASIGLR
jgi:hypothetical protein